MKALVVACCLWWLPAVHAQAETAGTSVEVEAPSTAKAGAEKEKKGGFSVFWVVFLVSILFVISSAAGLNALGGKPPPQGKGKTPPPRKKARSDDARRFRL